MKLFVLLGLVFALSVANALNATKESEKCKKANEIKCNQTDYRSYMKCIEHRRIKRQICPYANSVPAQVVQPTCVGTQCNLNFAQPVNCNNCGGSILCPDTCQQVQQIPVMQQQAPIVQQVPALQQVPVVQQAPIFQQLPIVSAPQMQIENCASNCFASCSGVSCNDRCDRSCQSQPNSAPTVVSNNSTTIIREGTAGVSVTSPNVTTIIKLTNIVNNTNVVNVPTNINNTNVNNLDLGSNATSTLIGGSERKEKEKCCMVVQPKVCHKLDDSQNTVRCVHRRHHTCGEQCGSEVVHAQVRQPCAGPVETCPPAVAYIPQPTLPRCQYAPSWPYVSCGQTQAPTCNGCYDHYGYGYNNYYGAQQPSCGGCYNDGFDAGPLYRQGPVFRPGYYHAPPAWTAPVAAPMPCGYGCFGNEFIDPAFGMQSYSPYGYPQYAPQYDYAPQYVAPQYLAPQPPPMMYAPPAYYDPAAMLPDTYYSYYPAINVTNSSSSKNSANNGNANNPNDANAIIPLPASMNGTRFMIPDMRAPLPPPFYPRFPSMYPNSYFRYAPPQNFIIPVEETVVKLNTTKNAKTKK